MNIRILFLLISLYLLVLSTGSVDGKSRHHKKHSHREGKHGHESHQKAIQKLDKELDEIQDVGGVPSSGVQPGKSVLGDLGLILGTIAKIKQAQIEPGKSVLGDLGLILGALQRARNQNRVKPGKSILGDIGLLINALSEAKREKFNSELVTILQAKEEPAQTVYPGASVQGDLQLVAAFFSKDDDKEQEVAVDQEKSQAEVTYSDPIVTMLTR